MDSTEKELINFQMAVATADPGVTTKRMEEDASIIQMEIPLKVNF